MSPFLRLLIANTLLLTDKIIRAKLCISSRARNSILIIIIANPYAQLFIPVKPKIKL